LSENLPPPPESLPLGDIEMPEGVYNAANRTDVNNSRKAQKLRELGKDEALRTLLGTKYGRVVIYDVLNLAGIWSAAGNPMPSATRGNSEALWFKEGARQLGIEINTMAWRASPSGYKLMLDENQ
jgi:hypothetical protein